MFIAIFVAGFLLAPLFAVLNNWVEIRLGHPQVRCEYPPPVAKRAQDIGICLLPLEAPAHLLVIMNVSMGRKRGIQGQRGKWRLETGKGGLGIGKRVLNSRVRDREIEAGARILGAGSSCPHKWVWAQLEVSLEVGPWNLSGPAGFPPRRLHLGLNASPVRVRTLQPAVCTALSTSHLHPHLQPTLPRRTTALGAFRLGSGPLWEGRGSGARGRRGLAGGGVLNLEAERGAGGRGGAGPNREDRKLSLRGGLPGRAEGVRAEGAGPDSRAGRGGRASRDPARSSAQVRGLSRDAQESCWPCVWVSPSPSRYLCIGQTWVQLLAAADQL